MLMDLFFDGVAVKNKRRVHFHEFMQEAHELIHIWRQNNRNEQQAEPISPVAAKIAKNTALLCFDEFEVRDIADAMIVSRLFTALLELGVVVVATSNRHPDELYKDGLQRDLFLPFIKLVKAKMDILHLQDGKDYRLDRIKAIKTYIQPADHKATLLLEQIYHDLTDGNLGQQGVIEFKGRQINVPRVSGAVAFFSFGDLCSIPLGAGDYLLLAKRFRSIIISDVPVMTSQNQDLARRFMVLIDALYESKAHLVMSAAADPTNLYKGSDWGFEFDRTISRLLEMQSVDYIESSRQ
jgi:cell division protein ZapE